MAGIAVLGAGGWGTALALLCERGGHRVSLWARSERDIQLIRRDGENKRLLPGVQIPENIELTTDLSVAKAAEIIILAVPSKAVREMAGKLAACGVGRCLIVNAGKGFEEGTLLRLSQVIGQELEESRVVVLSGPSHAEEVSRGIPTTVVVASEDTDAAQYIQDTFMAPDFRVYVNHDIVGVELGGALKNVIALAAGVCDGLGLGDNAKAALMTRGITEMARLGVALGGNAQTFAGLSGIGDLIVTCTSMHSRNRRAGILIGEGMTAQQAIEKVGMTVEGYLTTRSAYALAQKTGVDMPIVKECYQVLFENKDPGVAIRDLMMREKKHEIEDPWIGSAKT